MATSAPAPRAQKAYRLAKGCCIIIAAALLAYTGSRSYLVSFTHDESLSYNYMVHCSFLQIMANHTSIVSANNHILNTLFMKLFDALFGPSEWSLRIQSVAAHFCYLLVTFLLLKDIKNSIIMLCGYILLNVNPYLLDFFSLARGYAMAISLMLVSIYYFSRFINLPQRKFLVITFVTACLAVLANFALLNYLLALIVIYEVYLACNYWPLHHNYKRFFRSNIIVLCTCLLILLICYPPISILTRQKQFFFGGDSGFWQDTVGTSIQYFLYGSKYEGAVTPYIQALIIIAAIGMPSILIFRWYTKTPSSLNKLDWLFTSLLLLIIAFCIAQHLFLSTKYLMERYALFITPLFLLVFIYFFSELASFKPIFKMPAISLLTIIAIFSIYHFSSSANLTYAFNWKYDSATKVMLTDLKKEIEPNEKNKLKLGCIWIYEPSVNFYRTTQKLDWLAPVKRESGNNFNFFYVDTTDYFTPGQIQVIKRYEKAQSYLVKNLMPLK